MLDSLFMRVMNGAEPGEMLDGTMAEADDRIANSLTAVAGLIRFQATKLPREPLMQTEAVRAWLEQMSTRIDGVAQLYRFLAHNDKHTRVDFSTYLRQVSDAAMASLSTNEQTEIMFDLKADCTISAKDAAAVGLVVGEAITNALKYAHPAGVRGKLWVTSRRGRDQGVVLEVADDGVGLPEGFDLLMSKGMGARLMRKLADQLSGRLEVEQPLIGLCIRLELPLFN